MAATPAKYLESYPGHKLVMVHREDLEEWDKALTATADIAKTPCADCGQPLDAHKVADDGHIHCPTLDAAPPDLARECAKKVYMRGVTHSLTELTADFQSAIDVATGELRRELDAALTERDSYARQLQAVEDRQLATQTTAGRSGSVKRVQGSISGIQAELQNLEREAPYE